jgi:RNA polymerase sigma-70 factor (TIGR02960 family)
VAGLTAAIAETCQVWALGRPFVAGLMCVGGPISRLAWQRYMRMTTDTFDSLFQRHRREIHVHCYRMLGSFEAAEDVVQETFLRSWDRRPDSGEVRAWLYRVATNACIDQLRRDRRRVPSLAQSFAEVPWLTPYPDRLLDEVAPRDDEPDAVVVTRETIELAFLALIQLLPARQRAVLIMRDVLEFSAAETAEILDTTVPSVTSALQRARATIATQPAREKSLGEHEQELLRQFMDAHERGDIEASVALMREDIRVTMPPFPYFYEGADAVAPLTARAREMGEWRLVATAANRMPAAACYLRKPGDSIHRAFKLDVIRFADDRIAEVTTFGAEAFPAFGLAETLCTTSV